MTPALRQIVFINTAHTFTHYSLLILPTAVLAMAVPGGPFGESYGPILALATGMFVFYGLLSLPQGWLAQRVGRKVLMTAFFLGTGLGLIGAGLAHSPVVLAVSLAFAGAFAAIYHPIGTTMLVEAAGDKPGKSIGVNGVFGNLGVALAPVVTAFLANQIGWRAAFVAPGILCALIGLLWMRTPLAPASSHVGKRPFPAIPRHLVRRAVLVLMLRTQTTALLRVPAAGARPDGTCAVPPVATCAHHRLRRADAHAVRRLVVFCCGGAGARRATSPRGAAGGPAGVGRVPPPAFAVVVVVEVAVAGGGDGAQPTVACGAAGRPGRLRRRLLLRSWRGCPTATRASRGRCCSPGQTIL